MFQFYKKYLFLFHAEEIATVLQNIADSRYKKSFGFPIKSFNSLRKYLIPRYKNITVSDVTVVACLNILFSLQKKKYLERNVKNIVKKCIYTIKYKTNKIY